MKTERKPTKPPRRKNRGYWSLPANCPGCSLEGTLTERLVPSIQMICSEDLPCDVNKWVCTECGAAFMSPAQATEAVKRAVAAYQVKHGLMTADRIRSGRKKHCLTAGALATKAKVSIVTIKRLEAGTTVQKAGTNKLLEFAVSEDPELPDYEISLECTDFSNFCEAIPVAWSCEKPWNTPNPLDRGLFDHCCQDKLELVVG